MRITFHGNMAKISEFVKICETFRENIDVKAGRFIVDGKSILGLAAICTNPKIEAIIMTDNPMAQADFYDAIKEFIVEEEKNA